MARARRTLSMRGRAYRFVGTGLRDYETLALPGVDEFDRWAQERDRSSDNSVAARYVSRDVIGYGGSRHVRHVASRAGVRERLDADAGGLGLGAVSRWSLGLGRPLGLDLGRRGSLGLRRFALRSMGQHRRQLGLGTRSGRGTRSVCASARCLLRGQ